MNGENYFNEAISKIFKEEYTLNDLENDFKNFDWSAMMSDWGLVETRARDKANQMIREIKKLKQAHNTEVQHIINKYKNNDFFNYWFKNI